MDLAMSEGVEPQNGNEHVYDEWQKTRTSK
jgi:hypothetical protein